MPTYLVERYWPGVTNELLVEALNRGRQMMQQMYTEGAAVHHLTSILIPAEEVVFSLYEGPSAAAVLELNEGAVIPVARIVDAIQVTALDRLAKGRRIGATGLNPPRTRWLTCCEAASGAAAN